MTIILYDKQIDETIVNRLEEQRQIFRNSPIVKKRCLQHPILVYEVRVKKWGDFYTSACCNNFSDVPNCVKRLEASPTDKIEVIIHDNYFLERFL